MSKAQKAAMKAAAEAEAAAAEAEAVAAEAEARAQEEAKKKGVVKGACCRRVLVQTVELAPMFLHCDCCPRRAQHEIAPQSGPVRMSACALLTSGVTASQLLVVRNRWAHRYPPCREVISTGPSGCR